MMGARKLTVVYSPLCEANGAFLGQLKAWLAGTDVEIEAYPFDKTPPKYNTPTPQAENCFIDVFYEETLISSVPLMKESILKALGLPLDNTVEESPFPQSERTLDETILRQALLEGRLRFFPITKETLAQEMQMCLRHYPAGNPPLIYHQDCIALKAPVFNEVWEYESCAGIYAELDGDVLGLLEVMPRNLVKKYGFLTGTRGTESETLCITCYEVAYGVSRVFMLDELMRHLLQMGNAFSAKKIEGVGILGCRDGFNPYWVYEKYGFRSVEQLSKNSFVMQRSL